MKYKSLSVLIFFFIIFLTLCIEVHSQSRAHTTNTNAWLMSFGNYKFSNKFGIHAEVQWRRHEYFSERQQLLLRFGLDYHVTDRERVTIGYGFIETYPYGEFAVPQAFPEHRIWEQLQTTQSLGKAKLAHRYRLEQRMIGNAATGEFEGGRYENRFRYMAKLTYPIGEKLFAAAYDEIFVNFGKDVGYNLFDQNRLYGALGINLNKVLKLELGYLYQAVQLRSLDVSASLPKNRIEDNHTIQIGLFSNFNLYK